MQRFDSLFIIIETDEPQQPAVDRVLQMSVQAGSKITLFANAYNSSVDANFLLDPDNLDTVKNSLVDYQTQRLQELKRRFPVEYQVETVVVWQDSGYLSTLTHIEQLNPDLVVKRGYVHNSGVFSLLNAETSQLLKACPCPILFVGSETSATVGPVLGSLDPGHKLSRDSGIDDSVLDAANRLANTYPCTVHTCHCFDPGYWEVFLQALRSAEVWTDVFPANPNTDGQRVLKELREQHYKLFTKKCEEMVPSAEQRHFIEGPVVEALPKLASVLQASTIVIGTSYRTGLLGSTAEQLLTQLETDVLVVKPKDFVSPAQTNT